MGFLALVLLPLIAVHANPASASAVNLDSLRGQIASLSSQGRFDSAASLVKDVAPSLPVAWGNLLDGKLELRGDAARKAFETASKDSLHGDAPRGEALFRLGQLHYATGKYPRAILQFRQYLTRYSRGPWKDPAAYWMAYSWLQLSRQSPAKKGCLDSGLRSLSRIQNHRGYYFPLALATKARLLLARGKPGDTTSALAALEEARRRIPPEEFAATLLLSAQAAPRSNPDDRRLWEDSVLWEFPASLEASFLVSRFPAHKASPEREASGSAKGSAAAAGPQYALLLGTFSVPKNADEIRKNLAAKGIRVWIEQKNAHESRMFYVLHGIYPDSASARKEGLRLFKPLAFPFQIIPLP